MPSDNTIFNSGKYSGKTFKEVYDKYPEYVNFISSHKYLKNQIFCYLNSFISRYINKISIFIIIIQST